MAKYQRGDVVSLISGGMAMTVTGIYVNDTDDTYLNAAFEAYCRKFGGPSPAFYVCSWFERRANKEKVFPEESLKLMKTDDDVKPV